MGTEQDVGHTPGPWEYKPAPTYGPGYEGGGNIVHGIRLIAAVGYQGNKTLANIRLIAAAPDLLIALKNLIAMVNNGYWPEVDIDEALAAIAKAKGK